jgi:hypothetical protein
MQVIENATKTAGGRSLVDWEFDTFGADAMGSEENKLPGGEAVAPARYRYRVVGRYAHDLRAFTQGLVFHAGRGSTRVPVCGALRAYASSIPSRGCTPDTGAGGRGVRRRPDRRGCSLDSVDLEGRARGGLVTIVGTQYAQSAAPESAVQSKGS